MRVLTLCQGGNSRSVACAFVLKYKYGIDALACGWEKNSKDTLEMLFQWADRIVVMQAEFAKYITDQHKNKVRIIDVGPDVWFNSLHPELIKKVEGLLKKQLKW